MGGNALKHAGVRRVNYEHYYHIKQIACSLLRPYCKKMEEPRQLRDKDDYGDVDIIVVLKSNVNPRDIIDKTFLPRDIVHNGNIYSFNIACLQIDLILTTEEKFSHLVNYMSYGDLGMIIGTLARSLGYKYGQNGLEYLFKYNGQEYSYLLSRDTFKILEFLGYDSKRFRNLRLTNFSKDVINFSLSSLYMNNNTLQCKSTNRKHRKRNNERSMWAEFISYTEHHINHNPLSPPSLKYAEIYFEKNITKFQIDKMKEIDDHKAAKEKFSGKHIRDIISHDITPKEFGEIMKKWTHQFANKTHMVDFILNNKVEILTTLAERCIKETLDN